MKQVAIIGLGPGSHDKAPVNNPDWETWGLARDPYAPQYDQLFEMHDISLVSEDLIERLDDYGLPVWMQQRYENVPLSKRYPLESVVKLTGDYFCSNIAYMIALAIWEWRPRIGLWGVELSSDIYDHHRPNLEYLIGLAEGVGTDVEIHGDTKLMQPDGMHPQWKGRYGWL